MKTTLRVLPCVLALAFGAVAAQAQPANRASSNRDSFIPSTQQGYVGLSGGQSKYDLRSGTGGFSFDDTDTAWKIYTGGYFNQNFGIEFGYLNFGNATRVGGETKAQGLNLSLVGRLPLSEQFDVFGKVGTTYGRTKTSGNPGFGVTTGDDNGFGLSYGAGVRWAFNPQWAAVVEWERHRMNFADGKSDVDMTTVGVQYRY
ncbi:outer membrane beta-barrel protein [Paracidovorax valerianellae]|uniref:Opacity protein n=1 Tax=Paracidovorax valerianellae TaxID=187868 RepID=A0A1G6MLA3_9BURK|nr:outer membrane beta-barrel protein [Paracidovorax valerianellae]MDA8443991.1 outer membrane beta-barrel protein [Paracidovorax valerianellae]SDC56064.1 Opacity protein [Paracidovorax valerianellae]